MGLYSRRSSLIPVTRAPLASPSHFAISYYYERDYASSVAGAKEVIERYPNDPRAYRWLAAALGQLGQFAEAREDDRGHGRSRVTLSCGMSAAARHRFLPENY